MLNSDLKFILYPFVIGMFVGGAVVAVAMDRTSERELDKAEALARVQTEQCRAAVVESRNILLHMEKVRREACDGTLVVK